MTDMERTEDRPDPRIQKATLSHSADIGKISEALAKAQGAMGEAAKDASNTYFNSKYADLSSVVAAIKKPLSDNDLAYVQLPMPASVENGIRLITMLTHKSGEWFKSDLSMVAGKMKEGVGFTISKDPQAMGSCITYARRYALQCITGLPAGDDDGAQASGTVSGERPASTQSSTPDTPADFIDFGKHKGVAWDTVETTYLLWCKDKGPARARATAEAEFERRKAAVGDRPTVDPGAIEEKTFEGFTSLLKQCVDLQALKAAWTLIPVKMKAALVPLRDERKKALAGKPGVTKPAEATAEAPPDPDPKPDKEPLFSQAGVDSVLEAIATFTKPEQLSDLDQWYDVLTPIKLKEFPLVVDTYRKQREKLDEVPFD